MNEEQMKGQWNQLKGKVRNRWGRLTDDDLDRIQGSSEQAIGRIQERYGVAKEAAEREWNEFWRGEGNPPRTPGSEGPR